MRADVVIACDGINSAIRKQFYPDDEVAFAGINTWRGVTRRKPILTGRSYMRVGSILTGKIVIYPIVDNVDGDGNQLINWMAEIKRTPTARTTGTSRAISTTSIRIYEDWRFDWLDVARDDPQRRPDPRISDGRQGPDRRNGPSAASRSRATPRIRCIRAARTARRRR